MRELVKRVGLLDSYSKWIIRISILVIFISIFELLGYWGGLLEVDLDLGLIGATNNFSVLINAIQYIISALIGISPLLCSVLLLMSYSRLIYDTKYMTCIVPERNSDKILRIFKVYGFWILSYFVMNVLLYGVIFNGEGIQVIDIFVIVLKRFAYITFASLGVIVMDIECKESLLKKAATIIWSIIFIVFSNFFIFTFLIILEQFKFGEMIVYSTILFIAVLEGFYILKRVDKVKVN